jgi:hypothetical protein
MRRSTNGKLIDLHLDGQFLFFVDLAGMFAANAFTTWLAQFRKYDWLV